MRTAHGKYLPFMISVSSVLLALSGCGGGSENPSPSSGVGSGGRPGGGTGLGSQGEDANRCEDLMHRLALQSELAPDALSRLILQTLARSSEASIHDCMEKLDRSYRLNCGDVCSITRAGYSNGSGR